MTAPTADAALQCIAVCATVCMHAACAELSAYRLLLDRDMFFLSFGLFLAPVLR